MHVDSSIYQQLLNLIQQKRGDLDAKKHIMTHLPHYSLVVHYKNPQTGGSQLLTFPTRN